MKADKELKPASLRVKEAAEAVLCVLMEYTVCFAFILKIKLNNPKFRIHSDEMTTICRINQLTNKPYFKCVVKQMLEILNILQ
jgi:hypothetical protein